MTATDPTLPFTSADLVIEPPVWADNNQIEYGCRLETPQSSRRIWFRFPRTCGPKLTSRADPFVIATLTYAMGRIGRLKIHGTVSDGLLANLTDFQAAYAAFHHLLPLPQVQLTALATADAPVRSGETTGITAFSGGVDSCFSVFRHTSLSTLAPKRGLGAALMMHGFDIPLDQPGVFARSLTRSRMLTDDAGLKLHFGSTNLRTLPVPWEATFATAVAASLSFFQPGYAFGLVPSFQDWAHAHFDHGSNPLTDPLLSSLAFPIVHDGTSYGRIGKLQQLVKWPAALRHLRVCWQGEELDRNCCHCEKCLRTRLMLRLCGVTECEAFPLPLEVAAIDALVIKNQSGLDEFSYLLDEARRMGLDEPWVAATARALQRNRRNQRLWARGQTLAQLVPSSVRVALRHVGHRWLWRTRAVPPLPTPAPTRALPAQAQT